MTTRISQYDVDNDAKFSAWTEDDPVNLPQHEAHPKPPSVTSPSPAPQQLKQKAVTLSQNTIPTKPTTQKAKPASAQPEAPPGRIVETLHQEGSDARWRPRGRPGRSDAEAGRVDARGHVRRSLPVRPSTVPEGVARPRWQGSGGSSPSRAAGRAPASSGRQSYPSSGRSRVSSVDGVLPPGYEGPDSQRRRPVWNGFMPRGAGLGAVNPGGGFQLPGNRLYHRTARSAPAYTGTVHHAFGTRESAISDLAKKGMKDRQRSLYYDQYLLSELYQWWRVLGCAARGYMWRDEYLQLFKEVCAYAGASVRHDPHTLHHLAASSFHALGSNAAFIGWRHFFAAMYKFAQLWCIRHTPEHYVEWLNRCLDHAVPLLLEWGANNPVPDVSDAHEAWPWSISDFPEERSVADNEQQRAAAEDSSRPVLGEEAAAHSQPVARPSAEYILDKHQHTDMGIGEWDQSAADSWEMGSQNQVSPLARLQVSTTIQVARAEAPFSELGKCVLFPARETHALPVQRSMERYVDFRPARSRRAQGSQWDTWPSTAPGTDRD
eukprot:CAMPEP_0114315800 /NCGR_PEP_ID=MMETSP0059-20121206/22795_1 /TAXON_ID=36894 /ORGANISM="Pyramimonas parkeae, Strain CCMP726" /LENGTH=546 /DNA_ID=CAMNT_0001441553 /DNA_START=438 /DNA_END=2077 /DNA_ORIENTATION=+